MAWLRSMILGVIDSVAWGLSILTAVILRFEFNFQALDFPRIAGVSLLVALVSVAAGYVTHLYRNRFVIGSLEEARALFLNAVVVGLAVGLPIAGFGIQLQVPRSTVFIGAPFFLLLSGGARVFLRHFTAGRAESLSERRRALIYGAGDSAEALVPQLLRNPNAPYVPVVLVDDSPSKVNRWIRGVPMGGKWEDLSSLVRKYSVSAVIVAIPSATSELLSKVYEDSSKLGLQVVVLPSLHEFLGGKQSAADLRVVGIEDLLGRKSLQLDSLKIGSLIRGKRILITGGGGSIGSELARQIAEFGPEQLTIADRDETSLLGVSSGLAQIGNGGHFETYLVDIRDSRAVDALLESRKPHVVFHAAALKHVTILEEFPQEAWKTNVEGTLNVLKSSSNSGVSVFVNISTDKAVNPVNTLGRSKKLGEELTAWFGKELGKAYVSVRFGNVLGSRGSLVPVIADQIMAGGPVRITDRAATRYFMSIFEACQLVLQAAAEGRGGEVLVLNMGTPVSIDEIAKRMIQLSGKDIAIEYFGLRPGEKLHEELFNPGESPESSGHNAIFRIQTLGSSPEKVLASRWF